ncbi:MAG: hypothetical protein FJ098_00435 [Deltaproteobacteria bacterium]|nr:hypothetical protein [Deltaproteobacteria bacterium]
MKARSMITRILLLALVTGLAVACTPRNLAPGCVERMEQCKAACPPERDPMGVGGSGLLGIGDPRNKCLKGCRDLCKEPGEAPAPPAEGPPTL